MANAFKVGTFTKATGAASVDQAITGVGFQPKALILICSPQTATGYNADLAIAIGFAAGTASTAVHSMAAWSDDAVSTSAAGTRGAAKALTITIASTGAAVAECDLKSFDADGFTLTWTTNNASAYEIFYIAFGGGDITNVAVHKPAVQSGTGNKSYTGVGFQPDCMFILCTGQTTITPATSSVALGFGFALSSSKRWCSSISMASAATMATTLNAQSYQRTDSCLLTLSPTAGTEQNRYDFVSFGSDGYTLNQIAQGAANSNWVALCIKGGSWDCGSFIGSASAGNQAVVTGMAFKPDGYGIVHFGGGSSTSIQTRAILEISAADGASQYASGAGASDTLLATACKSVFRNDKAISDDGLNSASPTATTTATHTSFNSDGFTVNWATGWGNFYLWFAAKLAFPPATPVDPSTISGLQAWYKADAITGLSDGAVVGTWNDSSGNGWDVTQATAARKPLYKTNQLNGLPSVRSDGSDDYLENTSYSHASTSLSFFAVWRDNRTSGWNRDRVINVLPIRIFDQYDVPCAVAIYDVDSIDFFGSHDANFHRYSIICASGGNITPFQDGVSLGSAAFSAQSLSVIQLLSESAVNAAQIDLCEVFFYDRALTGTEQRNLDEYLRQKYFPPPVPLGGFFNFFPTI